MTVRLAGGHRVEAIEAVVRDVPGVQRAEAWIPARGALAQPDGTLGNVFQILSPPASSDLIAFRPIARRWLRDGDANGIVVSRALLRQEPNVALDSAITVVVDGRATTWTVIGIVDGGPTPSAWTTRGAAAAFKATDTGQAYRSCEGRHSLAAHSTKAP